MENKIDVLDHGFVRLVDSMGSDLSVVRAARVSYDAAWRAGEDKGSDERLIKYLWDNKHTTPFESVTFTFEVKAPIFVIRQWHRHRTWSYNELSARYRELPEEFYTPQPEAIGTQNKYNKQMRDIDTKPKFDPYYIASFMQEQNKASFKAYKRMIDAGVPRELARSVLPLSTYTHMFATVNLLNLLKFLKLRNHDHAQYEIRVYAEAIEKLIEPVVPVVMKAYNPI